MTEKQVLNTEKFILARIPALPAFVSFDETLDGGTTISRHCRHDGTLAHTQGMLREIMSDIGGAIFGLSMSANDLFFSQRLVLGNILIESEFLGCFFSRENEQSGERVKITLPYRVIAEPLTDERLSKAGYKKQEDGARLMRERGQPFFFLPIFGFATPEEVPPLPDDYGIKF